MAEHHIFNFKLDLKSIDIDENPSLYGHAEANPRKWTEEKLHHLISSARLEVSRLCWSFVSSSNRLLLLTPTIKSTDHKIIENEPKIQVSKN